jgi:hypothetical protein
LLIVLSATVHSFQGKPKPVAIGSSTGGSHLGVSRITVPFVPSVQ